MPRWLAAGLVGWQSLLEDLHATTQVLAELAWRLCVATQGCNLLGVGSETGTDPTCGGGSCQSVANSRPCRCPAQSCDGEQAVFSMPDLYDQWSRGDTPARLGAVGAQGTVAVPAGRRNVAWDDVIRTTRANRASAKR